MPYGSDSPRWMVSDEQDDMHGDVHDEMIERIAARLRPFPEVDPAARARLLVAVAAERERDRERQRAGLRRPRVVRWAAAAALGLAAALAFAVVLPDREVATPEAARATAGAPVTTAQPGTTPAAA